jgi:hypothetical protein
MMNQRLKIVSAKYTVKFDCSLEAELVPRSRSRQTSPRSKLAHILFAVRICNEQWSWK